MVVDVERTRLDEIQRHRATADPADPDLEALMALAAQACETPAASVHVITPDHDHQVAAHGFIGGTSPRAESLCAVVLDAPGTVVVPDVGVDDRFTGTTGAAHGGIVPRLFAATPLRTETGVVLGRLCVVDDRPRELTPEQQSTLEMLARQVMHVFTLRRCGRELDSTRSELDIVRAELRRSGEQLLLFAGQVSHDLRTPLTAILANAEMLTSEPAVAEDADVQWMVDGIQRAGHRLDRMIEEMVGYARVGGDLVVESTDLDAVARAALTDLRTRIEEAGATISLGDLPTVDCDAQQIRVVLLNLLDNAVKFARPDEAPVVHVDAQRRDGRWRVSVVDHGIGVPADRREAMFVLFARVDKRIEGSGVGLATVQRTVQAHGGRVGMDETSGGGTTVWFELPA